MEKIYFNFVKPEETHFISRTTLITPGMAYRKPTPLAGASKAGNLLAARSGKKLIGWIEISILGNKSFGISSLYVLPEFRDRDIGSKLIRMAVGKLPGRDIYTATSIYGLKKVLLELNFRKINLKDIPLRVIYNWFIVRNFNPATIFKLFQNKLGKLELYLRRHD